MRFCNLLNTYIVKWYNLVLLTLIVMNMRTKQVWFNATHGARFTLPTFARELEHGYVEYHRLDWPEGVVVTPLNRYCEVEFTPTQHIEYHDPEKNVIHMTKGSDWEMKIFDQRGVHFCSHYLRVL